MWHSGLGDRVGTGHSLGSVLCEGFCSLSDSVNPGTQCKRSPELALVLRNHKTPAHLSPVTTSTQSQALNELKEHPLDFDGLFTDIPQGWN